MNPEVVYHAIRGGLAGSTVLDAKAPLMMGRNVKPGFRIGLHIKDIGDVLEASHAVGVPLLLPWSVMEILQTLKVNGMGDCDHGAIVRFYEMLAQVEVTRPKAK